MAAITPYEVAMLTDTVLYERWREVLTDNSERGERFTLTLTPLEATTLHGAVTLAMAHPEVQTLKGAMEPLGAVRARIVQIMVDMGFTQEEAEDLDTLRE